MNDNAPLFTDEWGHRITEARIQASVERVATTAGEPLEAQGSPRFGTHSLRVAGALWAFQAGVSEETVRALGRWRSTSAMLVYLRDTPLVRAAEASAVMSASLRAGHTGNLMSSNFRPVISMENIRPEPDTDAEMARAGQLMTVRHGLTGTLHRPTQMLGPPNTWTTRCGWKWSGTGTAGSFIAAGGELCHRCFRTT